MMATPMAFVPHWFSWSLVGLGLVVLVVWEVRFRRYPERFWFGSNKLLQCAHCQEQLCRNKVEQPTLFHLIFFTIGWVPTFPLSATGA